MVALFCMLTLLNFACLGMAAVFGYLRGAGPNSASHVLMGALAALICCAVHCIVFTYFIATAKWVQHAVTVKQLDPALTTPTRSFRRQAFPAALLAIGAVVATAFLGAAADNYGPRWATIHHAVAVSALALNVLVAGVEYHAIRRNAALIDQVLGQITPG
jgi:hypothetical protein